MYVLQLWFNYDSCCNESRSITFLKILTSFFGRGSALVPTGELTTPQNPLLASLLLLFASLAHPNFKFYDHPWTYIITTVLWCSCLLAHHVWCTHLLCAVKLLTSSTAAIESYLLTYCSSIAQKPRDATLHCIQSAKVSHMTLYALYLCYLC